MPCDSIADMITCRQSSTEALKSAALSQSGSWGVAWHIAPQHHQAVHGRLHRGRALPHIQSPVHRKDMLDEALLRPGRLEVQVEIGLADEKGRLQILKVGKPDREDACSTESTC